MVRLARAATLALGVVFCACPAVYAATTSTESEAVITGRVVDGETGAPVALARVELDDTTLYKLTNREGRFVFDGLAPGTYALRITHVSYEEIPRHEIDAVVGIDHEVEIRLLPRVFLLDEITVSPGTFSFMDTGTSGPQTMSREDIMSVPQIAEDVFRAVNRLPGLSSGDYAAHFSIRGGRHDETLILLDELELYEPYHLKDFNEGAISIIDAEMVQGVELMTGGFPATYGNKRSGVFKITSRIPDRNQYSVGLSFINARAMAMGPLADGKGAWIVSARSGYLDLVFSLINQNDLPSPRYHDIFAKLQLPLNPSQSLSVNVLHAGDRYKFDAASTTGFQDALKTRERASNTYGNSYAWVTLRSALGDRTTARTMLSAALVTRSRDGAETYVDRRDPLYEITNDRDLSVLGLRQDVSYRPVESFGLSYGVDLRRLESKDTFTNVVGQDPNDPAADEVQFYPVRSSSTLQRKGQSFGGYLSSRWRLLDPLVLETGARYDWASHTVDGDWSPRVGAALRLTKQTTLRAGWGHYRQIQGIEDVSALDEDSGYYPSELSVQWTAGLEQKFPNGAIARVEGYVKNGENLRPVYRNWKGGIDTFPETNEDRLLVFPTTSTARGVEIYYHHPLGGRLSLRASYAYSVIEETVDRIENVNGAEELIYDRTHPTPQDQRHAANVDATYRLARAWTLNASLSSHTGWPATLENLVPVVGAGGDVEQAVRPGKIYGARLPLYLRLDARLTRTWSTGSGGRWRLYFEVVNLTNHSNVFGYDYFRSVDPTGDIFLERDEESWFTILPSIGVSYSGGF